MIIVEGMDNSGKTTLIENIKDGLETQGVQGHFEHSPSHLIATGRIQDWLTWIEISLLPDNQKYVYDRYPVLSEIVYGPILRGSNLLSTTDHLERLKLLKPLIIYCRPDDDTIFDFRKPEMKGVKENRDQLLAGYDRMTRSLYTHGFDIHMYNFKDPKSKQSVKFLIQRVITNLERSNG